MISNQPFVSILTPVYNGERFLSECIESVLNNQNYTNWEYIIVNNCSSDRTLDIAMQYAEADSRIRVVSNSTFVNCEDNHNIALSLMSEKSKYCKVVSADDRITHDCLSELVGLAEKYPTVAIVGSYQNSDGYIKWKGLPNNTEIISGREVCRQSLLFQLNVFGNPTSALYRSNLIRKNTPFFPHTLPHSDTSACFKYLKDYNFGFVHKVLSFERIHKDQESTKVQRLGMSYAADIELILEFGPIYLSGEENRNLMKTTLESYYKWLGSCIFKMVGKELWDFQRSRMKELGYPIKWHKVLKGVFDEFIDEIRSPGIAFKKLMRAFRVKYKHTKLWRPLLHAHQKGIMRKRIKSDDKAL